CARALGWLVAASAWNGSGPCPLGRRPSARVISAARFRSGKAARPLDARPTGAKSDVTQLKVPSPARICWMDERSASRLAAYKHGRGAEYDDTISAREEVKRKYGVAGEAGVRAPPPSPPCVTGGGGWQHPPPPPP